MVERDVPAILAAKLIKCAREAEPSATLDDQLNAFAWASAEYLNAVEGGKRLAAFQLYLQAVTDRTNALIHHVARPYIGGPGHGTG